MSQNVQKIEKNNPIHPKKAHFIKLSFGGGWEQECFEKGTIRLGYSEFPFEKYLAGEWEEAWNFWYNNSGANKGVATRHINRPVAKVA